MSFIQKFFTGYKTRGDGETLIGELNRLWYDSNTNTIRISDGNPGGKIVSGSSMGSTVYEGPTPPPNPQAGWLWWDSTSGDLFVYYDSNWVAATAIPNSTYTLPKATTNTLGGIKIGSNLSIDSSGVVSVLPPDRIVSPNGLSATYIDNTGTTYSAGDIIPGTAISNLGSVANPWKDVYVSKGSIVIADQDVNVDGVSLSNTDKYIVIDRGGLKVTSSIPGREIFQLDNTGKLLIKSEIPLVTDSAALEVIGSLLGESLPIVNKGVMIHSSGAINVPSRVYVDGVGTQTTAPYDSAYAAFIGRYARNTVADPQPAQAGDIIVRFGGNAMADGLGLNTISNVRIDMTATETQSAEGRGSRIELWTTPIGSVVPQRSLHIDSQGIDLSEATDTNAGVTFKDGSLLKYWPSVTGNNGKILRTNGTDFFWDSETVVAGQVIFKGDWSAANPPGGGTPTIGDSTGQAGWQWIVSAAGTQDLGSGNITFAVGDLVIHNGTRYVRIEGQAPQIQADWTETNTALPAYIKHKPNLATVATSGSYFDLPDRPSIPAAQVNSDWDATSGLAQILHKPNIPTQYTDTLARAAITLTSNTPTGTTSTLTYTSGVFTFTSAAAMIKADGTHDGYLSSTDWTTFNNKSNTNGTVTNVTGTGVISVATGTTTPSISISQAGASTSGYLSSTDWTTFNNKSNTNGTVTSISGTGTVSGLTLTGTVTSSGSLTLGGTLSLTSSNVTTALGFTPYNSTNPAGYTSNTGTVTSVGGTGTVSGLTLTGTVTTTGNLTLGGTLSLTSSQVTTALGFTPYNSTNPAGYTTNVGTVTSVGGTGTVNGLTLTGSVTSSGSLALGGTLSGITNSNLSGTAGITNGQLANSTISGVALGSSLYNLTAGTGITFSTGTTYNGSTAITINNSITQYTDALARASLSAGTGISYNSSTGAISSTITQYTDALARGAISVSGSLSYNSGTGVISYTTPTYTVTTASASGGGALSLSGTTFTFTPASIPSFGVGGNQLVYVTNGAVTLGTTTAAQSIFGLSSGVALASNTRYIYEINTVFELTESGPGDPDLKYSLAVSGGAVLAKHAYNVQMNNNGTRTDNSAGITMMSNDITTGFSTAVVVATIKNTYNAAFIRGTIDVTTGGNVNFMITLSKAVSALSIPQLSYVTLVPVGAIGANTQAGTWA